MAAWGATNPFAPKPVKAPASTQIARAPAATSLAPQPGRKVVAVKPVVGKPAPTAGPAAAPVPAPAPAPAQPAAPPGFPSPYDSTYFTDLAAATDKANQQINGLNTDIANGQTDLNSTIAQLAKNQALQQQNAQLAENARGGFAQGALGQQEGQIAQNTLTTQNADTLKYSRNAAAWNSAIAAVKQGLSVEQVALAAASAARQAALGIEAPAPAAAASPAAAGAPAAAGKPPAPPVKVTLQPRSSHPQPKSKGTPQRAGKAATFLY